MIVTCRADFRAAAALFRRPQPLTPAMVLLMAIVPLYLVIGSIVIDGPLHVPEIELDRALPLSPVWSVVYLSLFLAALLPVFVIHERSLIRRTVHAFLAIWLAAFAVFLAWPTAAPVHAAVVGDGYAETLTRLLHASDVRANCFPSLHVAQCYVAALACGRVHRDVGNVALVWATLVALSTLLVKQHYVADVVGGIVLAIAAHLLFLRGHRRADVPANERRLAPLLAAGAMGAYLAILGGGWLVWRLALH